MTRTFSTAFALMATALCTHAQAQPPVRTESAASVFVYEAIGATPSILLGTAGRPELHKAQARVADSAPTDAKSAKVVVSHRADDAAPKASQ
ncbi:MAG: hypothetical protein ACM3PU_01860 [Gemmatimonadota bacterium]